MRKFDVDEAHEALTVDSILGAGGALAGALKGFELRPGQLDMARAVETALRQKKFLIAEAGTGTGKTLAYLVPAVLSGKRVVVSTATRNLQEQVFFKDIPLLKQKVGLKFSSSLLKGRSNYLCAQRFESFEKNPLFATPDDSVHWEPFRNWAYETQSGDRAETQLPDAWATWPLVSTTSDSCLGSKCSLYDNCFVTKARATASESQIIVVNHALFFADLSLRLRSGDKALAVLPDYDAVIFDEAHSLEDVATEYFASTVSSGRVLSLADDILKQLAPMDEKFAALTSLGVQLRTLGTEYFSKTFSILAFDDKLENSRRLEPSTLISIQPLAKALHECLASIAALCSAEDVIQGGLQRRAVECAMALDAVSLCDDSSQVYWAEMRGRMLSLKVAPIEIGQSLSTFLYDSVQCAVFTSATLRAPSKQVPNPALPVQTGGATRRNQNTESSFDFVVNRFGLSDRNYNALSVESPFDFEKQAALYVPVHLPAPHEETWTLQFAREVYQLVKLTGGRAFVLFTSHRQLEAVHALVSPHLDMPILKQGDSSKRALLEKFVLAPSVLFASQSFWEGIDIQGEALSLVIIDKLPFSRPDEPLSAARIEAITSRGGNAFDDYQVPHAALKLRQGFGRLIRSTSDRGLVVVGDVRLHTKRYGKDFLASLPKTKVFKYFGHVKEFWNAQPGVNEN
jgi:ATP-dependent DNA helicase DinG